MNGYTLSIHQGRPFRPMVSVSVFLASVSVHPRPGVLRPAVGCNALLGFLVLEIYADLDRRMVAVPSLSVDRNVHQVGPHCT